MKTRYTIKATCLSKQGKILSQEFNSYTKTHPLQKYFAEKVGHIGKEYLHAEIAAILKAGTKKIHTIKIVGWSSSGNKIEAKPCPICMEAIKTFGIKEVIY